MLGRKAFWGRKTGLTRRYAAPSVYPSEAVAELRWAVAAERAQVEKNFPAQHQFPLQQCPVPKTELPVPHPLQTAHDTETPVCRNAEGVVKV